MTEPDEETIWLTLCRQVDRWGYRLRMATLAACSRSPSLDVAFASVRQATTMWHNTLNRGLCSKSYDRQRTTIQPRNDIIAWGRSVIDLAVVDAGSMPPPPGRDREQMAAHMRALRQRWRDPLMHATTRPHGWDVDIITGNYDDDTTWSIVPDPHRDGAAA